MNMIMPTNRWAPLSVSSIQYELVEGATFRGGGTSHFRPGGKLLHLPPDPPTEYREASVSRIKIHTIPHALVTLIEEINYASPKEVVFFDGRPFRVSDKSHPVNWVDFFSIPHVIPIFINPETATPEIVAHELMHVYLEMYLGFEDHRQFMDPRHGMMSRLVDYCQSQVLDCKILEVLRARGGFELSRFKWDIIASAFANITPYRSGSCHATQFGSIVGAGALAIPLAFPDLYELGSKERKLIQSLRDICKSYAPEIWKPAEKMADAMASNGLESPKAARRAIDGCLDAAFEFLGLEFDQDAYLTPRHMEVAELDKLPGFLGGVSPLTKHRILRESIRMQQHIANVQYPPGRICVEFAPKSNGFSIFNLPKVIDPFVTQSNRILQNSDGDYELVPAQMLALHRSMTRAPELDLYHKQYVLKDQFELATQKEV